MMFPTAVLNCCTWLDEGQELLLLNRPEGLKQCNSHMCIDRAGFEKSCIGPVMVGGGFYYFDSVQT